MDIQNENERLGIAELLAFYADMGVDAALVDEPVDRFAASAAQSREPRAPEQGRNGPQPGQVEQRSTRAQRMSDAPPAMAPKIAVPDGGQITLARERASQAATLDDLRALMAEFEGCNLKFTAKNLVFADGNPQAGIMFVGEAPGRDEDLEGLPFVGRSGQLLDRMLAAMGLDRQSAYIANVIPWRPPGNRTPTPQETEICRPFIERQVELVNPKVLVTLGGSSAKTLLNTSEGIMRLRGNWKTYVTAGGVSIPAMPTLHPAYLLRNPAHKKFVWRDFLEIKTRLRALSEA